MSHLDVLIFEVMFYIGKVKHILLALLAALLFIAIPCFAEPINAASFIGICSPNFPCTEALKAFPRSARNVGYLYGTFGSDCRCMRRFSNLAKANGYVRVHAVNGTCFPSRGRTCDKGEMFYKESVLSASRKLVARDPRLLRRFRKHLLGADKQVASVGSSRISLCLECPISNSARRVMLTVAKRTLPHRMGQFVDSPIGHSCLKGTICERHGVAPRLPNGCIADNDGAELTRANLSSYLRATKNCEARYYWTKSFNLISPAALGGKFVLPKERMYRATKWDFRRLRRFLRYSSL